MENQPPREETPGQRTPSGPRSNGLRRTAAPPWLWLFLIGGLAIIFYFFMPRSEVSVEYSPWFLDQVNSGNIKNMSLQGNEVRGELRENRPYQTGIAPNNVMVHRFITYLPSDQAIDAVINKLRDDPDKKKDPVRIEVNPANANNGLVWLMLLLPTILFLGFIYVMMRRARAQF